MAKSKSSLIIKPIILLMLLMLSLLSFSLLSFLSLSSSESSPSLIQQACNSSLSPPRCISSLSDLPSLPSTPTPSDLILSSLSLSLLHLQTALSLSSSILASSPSNPDRRNAAQNCIDHLSLSSRRLSAASRSLFGNAHADARALLGAALLYQYDCWSALNYVNGTRQVADAMAFVSSSLLAVTSDALAMLAAMQRFGADDLSLWAPPQTERDGYWPDMGGLDDGDVFSFPADLSSVDATVCENGEECGYRTIQAAVDSVPDFGPARFVIHIKAGVYEETVRVPFEKTDVVFVGDGMGKTVITGNLNAQMGGVTTYNTATVGVAGDGFMARDLTVQNSAGPGSHQAVVRPEGWMPWRGEFALKTLFYGEYGSVGPGANESGRVEWSSRIPEEYLGVYSLTNFIQGDGWLISS